MRRIGFFQTFEGDVKMAEATAVREPDEDAGPETVTEIEPGATGVWAFGDVSGCIHTLDLDENFYILWMPDEEDDPDFDPEGGELRFVVDEILDWPRVNGIFQFEGFVVGDDDHYVEEPLQVRSDHVTWIAEVPAEGELEPIDLTELEEVSQVPPPSAWILIGDEASHPTPGDAESEDIDEPNLWTAPQMAQRGDLVFLYFVSPIKEIRYAARVLDSPFFDPNMEVNSIGNVSSKQWWVELSEFVEVPPVPFAELSALYGDGLILRGKPSHYVPPRVFDGLVARFGDLNDNQRLVLQRPIGSADLPDDAATIDLDALRELTSATLHREAMVEQYVVEPLLRLALATPHDLEIRPQVRLDSGIVDYAIYAHGRIIGVVEVKFRIRVSDGGTVDESPDMDQLLRYMDATGVPGMLIDAHDLVLVPSGGADDTSAQAVRLTRTGLAPEHLTRIADHFLDTADG